MERRTYNRSPVRLAAKVHDQQQQVWDFIITDFGFDGLRLSWQNKTSIPDSFAVDDLLDVKFTIHQQSEQQDESPLQNELIDYHLEVIIIRVLEDGLAVALYNPSLNAIAYLSKKQQQQGMHDNPGLINGLNKKSNNILEAVEQSFINSLSELTELFFPIVLDDLFEQAEQSSNNTLQAEYFDAINTLNKSKNILKNQFLKQLNKHLYSDEKRQQSNQESQDLDELALIDQNDFESWLAVNQLIVHVSPNYEQELLEIELRLAKLLEADIKEVKNNPFSPEVIFKSFSEAIHNHFLNNDILLVLYHQFEQVVDQHLFDVYKKINQIFIDNNVLALIEKKKLLIVKEPSASQEPSANIEPSAGQEPSASIEPSAGQQPSARQETSTDSIQKVKNAHLARAKAIINNTAQADVPQIDIPQVSEQQTFFSSTQNTSELYQEQVANAYLTDAYTVKKSVNLQPAYQTLKELFSFQNNSFQDCSFQNEKRELEISSDELFASEDYKIELNNLIKDLSLIQYEQAKNVTKNGIVAFDLQSLVHGCINNDDYSSKLKNEFNYALQIIQHIFISIEKDSWLGAPIKKLISLLQVPLLKVCLFDRDFFESPSNPARIMINKLALIDFDDENNKFYLKAHSFVLYVLKNYNDDVQLFSKVQQILTDLLEIQSVDYKEKVDQVITHWDAQQFVAQDLANRLAGQSIPLLIADFISFQWLPILVNSYLKNGQDSSQWRQYIQVLDMLILRINGDISDELIDKEVIIFIIHQGLEESGQYDKKIIETIESFLLEGSFDCGNPLEYDTVNELLINGHSLSDKSAIARISKDLTHAVDANKTITQRLKVYDYLFFKENNKTIRLQFIWLNDTQNVFVFSGRSGQQQFVFNLLKVSSMLVNGQLFQTKDYDSPLLERCLYATLGEVHDNIAQESVIDKLTGLMNQREFIRLFSDELEQRKQAVQTSLTCALCLINIDHFSLINNTCGYEAGDQYLVEIAQLISKNLHSDAIVSRYGTDEFIALLPDTPQTEAFEILNALRKDISQCHFNWQDKDFAMTASIGNISISQYNEVGVFLNAVVTASSIAQEMGRNRVHTIEYDDIELSHRQGLQHWATKIDLMIKHNQLDIRCQRLHPLIDGIAPHYEMLLLVKDDNEDYMPPAEFIEAAELYNKMVEVDRWVIHYVFDWFSNHPEQLDMMGGIAINLSGQSLNDVDFYAFIQDIFTQYPDIPHKKICFEITETIAITNMSFAINVIHSIKEMGCEFSLDDFGTGLSSYAYLKNLPVDYLKIDGVFIKDIASNPADRAMVKSINEIGHFLGMKTVAEYVENDEIVSILKVIGVDYAQGFGIEKPILISDYMQFVNSLESKKIHERLKQLCSNLEQETK